MSEHSDMWPTHARVLPQGLVLKGAYKLMRFLGQGAFGAVYAAEQAAINRHVAVKVLHQGHDANAQERFLREAQAAARISHPNVVTIFDYGVTDAGQPFMVMELLEGRDLQQELDVNGALEQSRALGLFVGCLDALGEAHEHGIVHKDLKPSNLFLSNPGSRREALKILDFGIAHVGQPSQSVKTAEGAPPSVIARMTATGQSIGTPAYIAPEYVETQQVSAAVDVYQMGLILAEALSGEPVVTGESWWSCAVKHIRGELNFPDALMAGPLGPLLRKACARDPKERHPDANALRDAIVALNLPLSAGPAAWTSARSPSTSMALDETRAASYEVIASDVAVVVEADPAVRAPSSESVAQSRSAETMIEGRDDDPAAEPSSTEARASSSAQDGAVGRRASTPGATQGLNQGGGAGGGAAIWWVGGGLLGTMLAGALLLSLLLVAISVMLSTNQPYVAEVDPVEISSGAMANIQEGQWVVTRFEPAANAPQMEMEGIVMDFDARSVTITAPGGVSRVLTYTVISNRSDEVRVRWDYDGSESTIILKSRDRLRTVDPGGSTTHLERLKSF